MSKPRFSTGDEVIRILPDGREVLGKVTGYYSGDSRPYDFSSPDYYGGMRIPCRARDLRLAFDQETIVPEVWE